MTCIWHFIADNNLKIPFYGRECTAFDAWPLLFYQKNLKIPLPNGEIADSPIRQRTVRAVLVRIPVAPKQCGFLQFDPVGIHRLAQ